MQFPTFALKKEFSSDLRVGEKKLGLWKVILVAAVPVIAVGFLLATFILGSGSLESNSSSQDADVTIPPSILDFGKNISEETMSVISQRVLPMSQVYCSIQSCVVTCSGIPAASSPGIVAAVFVDSEYETQCPDKELVEELIFDDCEFLNNQLILGWLPTKFQLNKLTLKRCDLAVINSDALNTRQFLKLRSLAVAENAISIFQKSIFDALTHLEELVITDNVIEVADVDLLVGTANTLQVLQIDKAIYSEKILANIVGSNPLPKVTLLSLRDNFLQNITAETFRGVPNVQSVYLTNSAILSIDANAFDHFSGSIRQLFLSGNSLSYLPNDIFQSILESNLNFKVALSNNDWNCDCDLEWLKNSRSIFADDPLCTKPKRNAMFNFSTANFCEQLSTDNQSEITEDFYSNVAKTTQPITQEDEKTEADNLPLTLTCDEIEDTSTTSGRKLLSTTQELKFRSRFNRFFIREEPNGTVHVSLPTTRSAYTLIWCNCSDLENKSIKDFRNISCMTNVKRSVQLTQLESGVSYTICLLHMYDDLSSVFNCLSFRRASSDLNKVVWLESKDKLPFFSSLAALLILVCIVSVIGAYFVVWRNPRLLRGSKRIIMVRHRAADAIVLPEGLRVNSGKNDSKHRDYVTPMSQRRLLARKNSVISGASSRGSTTSYVSGIQPTTTQLMSWRLGKIKEILSSNHSDMCNNNPPPIPPPRNESIPSLSYNVDEKRLSENYRNPMATFVTSHDNDQRLNFCKK